MRVILATLLLAACGGGATAPAEHGVPEITFAELKPLVEAKKVILIDANGTDSFKEGHIPGAIDLAAHKDDLATLLPPTKDALIVSYCGGPQCSAWEEGATAASKLGYKQIKHFTAGMSGWKDSKGALETVQ